KADLGTNSLFICPLQSNGIMFGILVLGQPADEERAEYQRNFVERLTAAISIAIENQILYDQLQTAGVRLKQQNDKLIELDKSKDEFISMASHQLRTPLTAIKGYLSMVLEGDAGKVKRQQAEFLEFAFDGTERMVGLISDLLNVSRLSAGRFIVDVRPGDLGQVVAE